MFAGVLTAQLALAGDDASGARPGAGAPVLEWKPVLQIRTGMESESAGGNAWFAIVSGRVGLDAERKALRMRLSLAHSASWSLSGVPSASVPTFGEAWVRWSPPISSALALEFTGGLQPIEWDSGAVLGDDDLRLLGSFPAAGRLRLRAAPWELDLATGLVAESQALATSGAPAAAPFHALRFGAGRDNPAAAWSASGVVLVVESADPLITGGVTASTSLGRLRASADGYLQPTTAGSAAMGGAQFGWALGDDARVLVAGRLDWLGGGDSPAFQRPLADTHQRFGWLGLFDDGAEYSGSGSLDAALLTEATVAPQLRCSLALHHLWTAPADPLGVELDADIRWFLSPLAALHLRGGALLPWSEGAHLAIQGAVTIDAAL